MTTTFKPNKRQKSIMFIEILVRICTENHWYGYGRLSRIWIYVIYVYKIKSSIKTMKGLMNTVEYEGYRNKVSKSWGL